MFMYIFTNYCHTVARYGREQPLSGKTTNVIHTFNESYDLIYITHVISEGRLLFSQMSRVQAKH